MSRKNIWKIETGWLKCWGVEGDMLELFTFRDFCKRCVATFGRKPSPFNFQRFAALCRDAATADGFFETFGRRRF